MKITSTLFEQDTTKIPAISSSDSSFKTKMERQVKETPSTRHCAKLLVTAVGIGKSHCQVELVVCCVVVCMHRH